MPDLAEQTDATKGCYRRGVVTKYLETGSGGKAPDDAITNYERNIMIQTSAMKFNHRTIIALGSQSRLFIEIRCGVEDTGSRPRTGMLEVKAKY